MRPPLDTSEAARRWRPPEAPPGWTLPAEDDMRISVEMYNAQVPDLSRPGGTLPRGYPAYTAVLHRLGDEDRSRWLSDGEGNPWRTVQEIWERDVVAARWQCDVALAFDLTTARALAAVLPVTADAGPFVTLGHCGLFEARFEHELTGAAFVEWFDHLDDQDTYSAAGQLCVWFPTNRTWVASAPIDMASHTSLLIRPPLTGSWPTPTWKRWYVGGDDLRPKPSPSG